MSELSDEYDGPERREGYEEIARKLDDHVSHIEDRFSKWFKMGLLAFGFIGITSAIALVGFGFALREIQQQRREVCQSQNRRHDAAVRQFRRLARDSIKQQPENAARIRAAVRGNLAIIDALVPVQNCDKTVREPLK
jgi:hypothetical protein